MPFSRVKRDTPKILVGPRKISIITENIQWNQMIDLMQ